MPQHPLVTRLVHPFLEDKAAALSGLFQRPTRQDAGRFGDILLRVTTIHAERVQFHEFATVILVQATALTLGLFHRRGARWARRPAPVVVVVALGNAVSEV